MMYDGCLLKLSLGDTDGTYSYRVVKPDGTSVCPPKTCSEAAAKMLPVVFAGAQCNFKVVEGVIMLDGAAADLGSNAVDDLTYDENAERVSIFEGSIADGDSSREINVTKLEAGRGVETSALRKESKLTYNQQLALKKAELDELNKAIEEETEDAYAVGGFLQIDDQMSDSGFYFEPKFGCKAFVPGHCEELDHWGLDCLTHIPVPTPAQRAAYDAAVAAGVPEDQRPMSPEDIIGLCNRVVPLGTSAPCEYKDKGDYKQIPVYDSNSRVKVFSKKLLPDNYNAFVKWTGVINLMEQLDGMVAALMMTPSLKICFTERPGMTMGVSEDSLYVGLDFLMTHSLQELAFVLMHEARHLLFEHPTRRGFRNPTLWNLATDLIVNKQLTDSFDVDVNDPAGGRLILRLKDGSEILVSDGRPRPKFSRGGVYSSKIDITSDTAERVYLCLETGADDFDTAKQIQNQSRGGGAGGNTQNIGTAQIGADDVINSELNNKKNKTQPMPPIGGINPPPMPPIDLDSLSDAEKAAMLEAAKKQFLQNGGVPQGGGSGGGGLSAGMELSTSAYLALTLKQYLSILKSGMTCKGEKISVKDAEAARKIMAPYMNIFGLRF